MAMRQDIWQSLTARFGDEVYVAERLVRLDKGEEAVDLCDAVHDTRPRGDTVSTLSNAFIGRWARIQTFTSLSMYMAYRLHSCGSGISL